MAKYTYDQFEKAANESGLLSQFSTADLSLAKQNPDAGMSILKYKQDYKTATTDEARALANYGAEEVRKTYGNYTAGDAGEGFYVGDLSPTSFDAGEAPEYTSKYADEIAKLYEAQKNYGSFEYDKPAPEYTSKYGGQIDELITDVLNREDFSYDAEADPMYAQYKKTYAREGRRATEDALGAAAAASGGIPSSYAVSAAAQAGDYYSAQMADKLPELYELAYDKHLKEYNMKLSELDVLQGAEETNYAKYLNELAQHNAEKEFDYSKWLTEYDMLSGDLETARALEESDYGRYLDGLSKYESDRNFEYGVLLDEINRQSAERAEELERARLAASYGDYRALEGMGIDTSRSPADFEREYALAQLAAEYGDYSRLASLGINPNVTAGGGASSGEDLGDGAGGTLGSDDVAAIKAAYGGTELTDAEWSDFLAENPGITEDMLIAAGFTKKQSTEYDPSEIKDYASAKAILDGAGVSGSELLDNREWVKRQQEYARTGRGEGEPENEFEFYIDYLRFMVDDLINNG